MSLRHEVLEVLRHHPQGLDLEAIAERLRQQGRKTGAHDNTVRSAAAVLKAEGVLSQGDRRRYSLVRMNHQPTKAQQRVASILKDILTPRGFALTVIWDATPFLALGEDGPPGTRLVIEGKDADAVYWTVYTQWPESSWTHRWGHKGPLGDLLWQSHELRSHTDTGFLFVQKDRIGGTALTEGGYRIPFPERIALEFLGKRTDADLADAVLGHVFTREFDMDRAWQAARALGNQNYLAAYLAARYRSVPAKAAAGFLEKMPPAVRVALI